MTNRTLILMRHAKSSWADNSIADFDRPLNDRGRLAAPLMARWLEANSMVPDSILCSTAVRAQQTAERVSQEWTPSPEKIDVQALYLASPNAILEVLGKHAPAESKIVLVIGHNPGFEILASMLSGRAIAMPTAAVVIFRLRLASSWSIDLAQNQTRLEHIMTPREIQPSVDHD
jgi:phosphohistidine phosphatase